MFYDLVPGGTEKTIHFDDLVDSPHMYRTPHILLVKNPYLDRKVNILELSIVGTWSCKEENGCIGNTMKTNKFLEMAPKQTQYAHKICIEVVNGVSVLKSRGPSHEVRSIRKYFEYSSQAGTSA